MAPAYWNEAKRALARRDAVLAGIIRSHPGIALSTRGDAFQTLARSIVGQQISVKAAESVWGRFAGAIEAVEPRAVLRAGKRGLARSGLSKRKVEYLLDLARHFADGSIDVRAWESLDDEAVIRTLVEVRGIGRWTAQMFLIFNLMRPDVLPLEDLGLQRAVRRHYAGGDDLSVAALREIAQTWVPWRSVATWYLWRSLDPVPVEY
ncbi:MAG: DNA-3-methyladenine glycosylase 2 family protein [Betaproteobacteria bacterium]|nr:DNA-3-methyladenine glycosylase 2 family protein [Betaproteobacteria bacterium]MBI2959617.1 DNA-3-methyladenine glycosylase 2 family protein [Betaproteobacteria bacterium]